MDAGAKLGVKMSELLLQPFYEYLEKERQALLTKLDATERILGTSPRTAELRKQHKHMKINEGDNIAGAVQEI